MAEGDGLAVAVGGNRAEERAVGRVDERVGPDVDGPQAVEAAGGGERGAGPESDPANDGHADDASATITARTPPPVLALEALSLASEMRRGTARARGCRPCRILLAACEDPCLAEGFGDLDPQVALRLLDRLTPVDEAADGDRRAVSDVRDDDLVGYRARASPPRPAGRRLAGATLTSATGRSFLIVDSSACRTRASRWG